jgi:hypothetical protein
MSQISIIYMLNDDYLILTTFVTFCALMLFRCSFIDCDDGGGGDSKVNNNNNNNNNTCYLIIEISVRSM